MDFVVANLRKKSHFFLIYFMYTSLKKVATADNRTKNKISKVNQ